MSIERFILFSGIIIFIGALLYIPKGQLRKAFLAFILFQATTWSISLVLVQMDILQFPLREFPKATGSVFIPQFFIYPAFFTWFYLFLPYKPSKLYRTLHWLISISMPVYFAYFIAVYTDLSQFTKGSLIRNLVYLYAEFGFQYVVCFRYLQWFYSVEKGKVN